MKKSTGWVMLSAVLASGIVTPAFAQQGLPDTRGMSCPQVQSLIGRAGAAVLRTGANTYDRYVLDVAYCPRGDVVKPDWVPTRDGLCFVGGICWDPTTDSGKGR